MTSDICDIKTSTHKHNKVSRQELKIRIFRRLLPYNAQNATENDRGNENQPFSGIIEERGITNNLQHQCNNKRLLEDVLIVFRQKYVNFESRATAKHKGQKLTLDPNIKSLSDFLDELIEYAARAYGDNAQQKIDKFLYVKMPPHLKRSLHLA